MQPSASLTGSYKLHLTRLRAPQEEWLDLDAEQEGKRLQWLPSPGSTGRAQQDDAAVGDLPELALLEDVGLPPAEERAALVRPGFSIVVPFCLAVPCALAVSCDVWALCMHQ